LIISSTKNATTIVIDISYYSSLAIFPRICQYTGNIALGEIIDMTSIRYPRRLQPTRLNAKQRLHALLRENSSLKPQELAQTIGCTPASARIWKSTFFAKQYPTAADEAKSDARK
jgi:hypothetical protein